MAKINIILTVPNFKVGLNLLYSYLDAKRFGFYLTPHTVCILIPTLSITVSI